MRVIGTVSGRQRLHLRNRALTTVSALALASGAFAAPSSAYAAETTQSAEADLQEIVVTGSRIVREGYEAPTPLAVVGVEELESQAGGNITNYLNTLTVFSGNVQPNTNQAGISAGTAGLATINIRGLGGSRSLVLLDGQRSVASLATGAVDISNFPQQLIARVETVTGGASAVYGSDAVGGVTNFILDKTFTGMKGDISGGVTSYGDGRNYKIDLAGGFGFANDRGHALLAGTHVMKSEMWGPGKREWVWEAWCDMINPAYNATTNSSVPQRLILNHCGISNATHGGIITTGPLKGTAFGPGGTVYKLDYGDLVNDPFMHGGDWRSTLVAQDGRGNSMDPGERRQNVYTRFSYDITDSFNIAYSWSWGRNKVLNHCCTQFQQGNAGTITSDNAFIPAALKAVMPASITSFRMGSMNYDLPTFGADSERFVTRHVVTLSGKFDFFDSGWTWDAYYQRGKSRNNVNDPGTASRARFVKAIDAVRNTNGQIVCRVNANAITTDDDPLCQPYNLFGEGVNTQAAIDYLVYGNAHMNSRIWQDVWAASTTGEPFSIWAGPVSVAISAEHRKERTNGTATAGDLATDWFAGNYKPVVGQYSVTEGAVEVLVPLANGKPWADSFDFSAAARFTGYTTSGFVVTWKVGSTYSPIPDIKVRAVLSRDIRAPNLQELYAPGTSSQGTQNDPFTNTTPLVRGLSVGNPNLGPEKADSLGVGVVLQPSFVPGFNFSIDYWRVKIKEAIVGSGNPTALCFNGNANVCQFVHRSTTTFSPGFGAYAGQQFGVILETVTTQINNDTSDDAGIDVAFTYRMRLADITDSLSGTLTFKGDGTFTTKNYSLSGQVGALPSNGRHNWRSNFGLNYDNDPYRIGFTFRYTPATKLPETRIICTSGCPVSTPDRTTYNIYPAKASLYIDANTSYKFNFADTQAEVYLNIRNLLNRDPNPPTSPPGAFYYQYPSSGDNTLGRIFRLGFRFQL